MHPPARERDALMRKNLQLPLWKGIPNHTLHSAAHMHGLRIEGGFARRPVRESGLSSASRLSSARRRRRRMTIVEKEDYADERESW